MVVKGSENETNNPPLVHIVKRCGGYDCLYLVSTGAVVAVGTVGRAFATFAVSTLVESADGAACSVAGVPHAANSAKLNTKNTFFMVWFYWFLFGYILFSLQKISIHILRSTGILFLGL